MKRPSLPKPSGVYVGATYLSLGIGALGYLIGLWNAEMLLNEKGYYFVLLMFGLFSAVSLQKCVRDKLENIPVSQTYVGICYVATGLALLLLTIGLWNAKMSAAEKGFYAMSFVLALYSAVTVQKCVRDNLALQRAEPPAPAPDEFGAAE